jgi:hypothetical protein
MATQKTAAAQPEAQTVTINLDDVDWEQLEAVENLVGHPISDEFQSGKLSFRTIRAFVLMKLQETNPEMTFETMPSLRSMAVNIGNLSPVTGGTTRDPLASPRPRKS